MSPKHEMPEQNSGSGENPDLVVRDRRRIDPETGELRPPGADEADAVDAEDTSETEGVAELRQRLEERTADLQRMTAEYANYRKRVDRDREQVTVAAKTGLVTSLLPILDDLERAEAHGDLTGAFKAVADKITATLTQAGLEAFCQEGEEFDPSLHEAVQHNTSPDVKEPTVTTVMRRGYRFGDRVLRPAMVAVTDHEPGEPSPTDAGVS